MVPKGKSYYPDGRLGPLGYLEGEARAMLMRLNQVAPFSEKMPVIEAASISRNAQQAISILLVSGRKKMEDKVKAFISSLQANPDLPPRDMQAAFAILKLQFNHLLDQLDIFADALTQRTEYDVGIWLAGLDQFAKDSLLPRQGIFEPPPLICYLDRGHGAAIRRARTRLPGGPPNPVAVIRVPRERMISSGIASSLVHEVGHQGAALLGLINSLREAIRGHPKYSLPAWKLFDRWISEIVADCWSVASLGITATTGLMGVVSLPAYFVFRIHIDDPHPFPWIRVLLSAEIGKYLFPDPQWRKLSRRWIHFYPLERIPRASKALVSELMKELPGFAEFLCNHTSDRLGGKRLQDIFPLSDITPRKLRSRFHLWQVKKDFMMNERPTWVFATFGQARSDGALSPEDEHHLLTQMLRQWASKRVFQHT